MVTTELIDIVGEKEEEGLTYVLGGLKPRGVRYILCLMCNKVSYNSKDITKKYCGYCKKYHEEWKERKYELGIPEEDLGW